MKPAPFDYFAPAELSEALALLAQHGDEAKILAGGQSLMPMLNMRLATPQVVIDINRIATLEHITPRLDGGLTIGALTRQRRLERAVLVRQQYPVVAAALPLIGHFQIRNRGTFGGSLVHADPAAELPAVCVALEADFVVQKATVQRVIAAEDFFVTYLTTAIEPDELLTEIRLPAWPSGWGWGVQEICRRAGDFALVGAVAMVRVDADDVCQAARLVLFGVDGVPLRVAQAEATLVGRRVEDEILREVEQLVTAQLDPESDLHASAAYRKEVGGVVARRTLAQALNRARDER
ncbi:MAG: xanthine dehydrogenase family protein subunit M [bacterium]|nr:xanthine dehydrogenase family protein subunit M [bacterium]